MRGRQGIQGRLGRQHRLGEVGRLGREGRLDRHNRLVTQIRQGGQGRQVRLYRLVWQRRACRLYRPLLRCMRNMNLFNLSLLKLQKSLLKLFSTIDLFSILINKEMLAR